MQLRVDLLGGRSGCENYTAYIERMGAGRFNLSRMKKRHMKSIIKSGGIMLCIGTEACLEPVLFLWPPGNSSMILF